MGMLGLGVPWLVHMDMAIGAMGGYAICIWRALLIISIHIVFNIYTHIVRMFTLYLPCVCRVFFVVLPLPLQSENVRK